MSRLDVPLWERWLDKYAGAYAGAAYDVALGGQVVTDEKIPQAERDMWRYNTALRIDAVMLGPEHVLIIEVRPYATPSALGSALTYALVADRDKVFQLPIQPAVVCEGAQPDVQWTADRLGILIFVV